MQPVRLLVDTPAEGAWNMAIDEALLESAVAGERPTLRFYRWREPTLSLGYFQRAAERETHAASATCPLVRRVTGGGAIMHDRELTYSFTMPVRDRLRDAPGLFYKRFHGLLAQTLLDYGIPAELCVQPMPQSQAEATFLCFQRRSTGDLLVREHKIAGSAQRRRRTGLLQHGSLLLGRSEFAPELPGLADLGAPDSSAEEISQRWLRELERELCWRFEPGPLTVAETKNAERIFEEKFSQSHWNARR